jgi:hypothetical protein
MARAVFDFEVLPLCWRGQSLRDQGLRCAAMAAPVGAKFQQSQATQGFYIGAAGRFGFAEVRFEMAHALP